MIPDGDDDAGISRRAPPGGVARPGLGRRRALRLGVATRRRRPRTPSPIAALDGPARLRALGDCRGARASVRVGPARGRHLPRGGVKSMSAVDARAVTLMDGRDRSRPRWRSEARRGARRRAYGPPAALRGPVDDAATLARGGRRAYGAVVQPDAPTPPPGAPGAPGEARAVGVPRVRRRAMEEVPIGAKSSSRSPRVAEDHPSPPTASPRKPSSRRSPPSTRSWGTETGRRSGKPPRRFRRNLAGARDMADDACPRVESRVQPL